MPLEAPLAPAPERAAELNLRFAGHAATAVVAHALDDPCLGRAALVSSFGAEAIALLHMVSRIDRTVPVVFLDTEMLFPETLGYQLHVAKALGLTNLRRHHPDPSERHVEDPFGRLHRTNPDACCALRKSRPLARALAGFDAWITGRKRYQGGARTELAHFEADGHGRLKVNPLAHWSPADVDAYITNNNLPRHPLVARGYASLGCAPCTQPVCVGQDPRAGRWPGRAKTECGIHLDQGRGARPPERT